VGARASRTFRSHRSRGETTLISPNRVARGSVCNGCYVARHLERLKHSPELPCACSQHLTDLAPPDAISSNHSFVVPSFGDSPPDVISRTSFCCFEHLTDGVRRRHFFNLFLLFQPSWRLTPLDVISFQFLLLFRASYEWHRPMPIFFNLLCCSIILATACHPTSFPPNFFCCASNLAIASPEMMFFENIRPLAAFRSKPTSHRVSTLRRGGHDCSNFIRNPSNLRCRTVHYVVFSTMPCSLGRLARSLKDTSSITAFFV